MMSRLGVIKCHLSHDIVSGSDTTPCNKIYKPLVVYRFPGNVLTSIITLRKIMENLDVLKTKNAIFKYFYCHVINRI